MGSNLEMMDEYAQSLFTIVEVTQIHLKSSYLESICNQPTCKEYKGKSTLSTFWSFREIRNAHNND